MFVEGLRSKRLCPRWGSRRLLRPKRQCFRGATLDTAFALDTVGVRWVGFVGRQIHGAHLRTYGTALARAVHVERFFAPGKPTGHCARRTDGTPGTWAVGQGQPDAYYGSNSKHRDEEASDSLKIGPGKGYLDSNHRHHKGENAQAKGFAAQPRGRRLVAAKAFHNIVEEGAARAGPPAPRAPLDCGYGNGSRHTYEQKQANDGVEPSNNEKGG